MVKYYNLARYARYKYIHRDPITFRDCQKFQVPKMVVSEFQVLGTWVKSSFVERSRPFVVSQVPYKAVLGVSFPLHRPYIQLI